MTSNTIPLIKHSSSIMDKINDNFKNQEMKLCNHNYQYVKVVCKYENTLIYQIEDKKKPSYMMDYQEFKKVYEHPMVIKLKKLEDDYEKIKKIAEISKIRTSLDPIKCPPLLKYHEQGIIQYDNIFYHAAKYDDPFQNLQTWITVKRLNKPLKPLEAYMLLKNILESFVYLENNSLILNQFDTFNIFAGSEFEDRFNQFRLNFKGFIGEKELNYPSINKNLFYSPEKELNFSCKNYVFSLGLILIWCVFSTHSKLWNFRSNLGDPSNSSELLILIKLTANLLIDGKDNNSWGWLGNLVSKFSKNSNPKDLIFNLLSNMLQYNYDKRYSPAKCLQHPFFEYYHALDERRFAEELEESKIKKQKEF